MKNNLKKNLQVIFLRKCQINDFLSDIYNRKPKQRLLRLNLLNIKQSRYSNTAYVSINKSSI